MIIIMLMDYDYDNYDDYDDDNDDDYDCASACAYAYDYDYNAWNHHLLTDILSFSCYWSGRNNILFLEFSVLKHCKKSANVGVTRAFALFIYIYIYIINNLCDKEENVFVIGESLILLKY